ncbi:MAG: hypothetical protein ACKVOQ_20830 [Cyclobacteriaceae bacterium]
MIQLKPFVDIKINCPSCKNLIEVDDWKMTGMHAICSGSCKNCKRNFIQELPVNAGLFYPGIVDEESGNRCDDLPFDNWYLNGFVKAFNSRSKEKVNIKIIENKPLGTGPLLLLNTIDATYGHALYELFNCSYYLTRREFELVLIVQKDLLWLVPENIPHIWVVDISFGQAINWYEDLADKVKKLVENNSHVYLCRSFVQADSSDFDIYDYSKIKPFPLEKWDELLTKPTVTFIWRTDRFWKRVLPKWIDNRISRRLFPSLLNRVRNWLQFQWVIRFSGALKSSIPSVDFAIAGMDSRDFALPKWIKDYRYEKHSDETAREQCQRYANSHLVVGCNGSSLLLPGCHAGAVVNIVPGDHWAVSAGTFAYRITSVGDTHFRYQMVPEEVPIQRIVKIMTSILRDRSYILLQTSSPWRDHNSDQDSFAWSNFRLKAFKLLKYFKPDSGLITRPKSK